MDISNISSTNGFNQLIKTQPIDDINNNQTDKGNGFAKILQNSINALNEEQLISEHHKKDIATGEVKDLQKAIIEIDRAGLSMTLAGEVKNKILSAYKEIMNTQI